jgi:phage tail sheath protein FI
MYLAYTDGASANDPNRATFALAGGNDDTANIVDAQWQNAINLLTPDLGTGILIAPGRTSDAGHTQLRIHAEGNNRVAFLDAPDTATIATVTASAAANRSRLSGMFWPWCRIVGLTYGTYRTVAPSVIAAGIAARNDALGYSPNKPAAGQLGISNTVVGLTQDATVVTDANHAALNSFGVNVIRSRFGQFKILGWRTTVLEASDPKWVNLGNARLTTAIQNGAWLVGERFLFREIDGHGLTVGEFGAAIIGEVLLPYYLAGSLYGDRPDDAFRVDTSANTPATAQARQLLADLVVVESEFGEEIDITIAKNLITEGVA